MEESQEQQNIKEKRIEQLKPWQFKKGQSGNPGGRPVGIKSLKEYAKEMLGKMTEEERQEYLMGLDKSEIWRMSEGNPHQSNDTKVEGNLNITRLSFDEYNNPPQSETGQS